MQVMQGKTAVEVDELHAGDVGAIARLKETTTGDTLGDKTRDDPLPAGAHSRAVYHVRSRTKNARG